MAMRRHPVPCIASPGNRTPSWSRQRSRRARRRCRPHPSSRPEHPCLPVYVCSLTARISSPRPAPLDPDPVDRDDALQADERVRGHVPCRMLASRPSRAGLCGRTVHRHAQAQAGAIPREAVAIVTWSPPQMRSMCGCARLGDPGAAGVQGTWCAGRPASARPVLAFALTLRYKCHGAQGAPPHCRPRPSPRQPSGTRVMVRRAPHPCRTCGP